MDDFTLGMICIITLAAVMSAVGIYAGLKSLTTLVVADVAPNRVVMPSNFLYLKRFGHVFVPTAPDLKSLWGK
jgi:hypothetical protein